MRAGCAAKAWMVIRKMRAAVLVMGLALSLVPGRADAQKLTIFIAAVEAERGASACTLTNCSPANVIVPGIPLVPDDLEGRHVCAGTSLADTRPRYRCSVFVGTSLSGRAVAKNVPVEVTFEITSDDGAPWNDDVRRTLRAQAPLMRPPASGAPAPCTVVPTVDTRVSCKRVGPRTWRVSGSTSSKTGLYVKPLHIEFPSRAGTEPACEYLRVKGLAKSAGQTARIDLGRRRYCA